MLLDAAVAGLGSFSRNSSISGSSFWLIEGKGESNPPNINIYFTLVVKGAVWWLGITPHPHTYVEYIHAKKLKSRGEQGYLHIPRRGTLAYCDNTQDKGSRKHPGAYISPLRDTNLGNLRGRRRFSSRRHHYCPLLAARQKPNATGKFNKIQKYPQLGSTRFLQPSTQPHSLLLRFELQSGQLSFLR